VKKIVLGEIKKLKDLKQSDFSVVKEKLIGSREISKEKSDSTMMDLLQEELGGNASNHYNYEEKISKVKLKDVQDLSKLKSVSFVALVPE
jgi:predicted Zn-dependent peptidase